MRLSPWFRFMYKRRFRVSSLGLGLLLAGLACSGDQAAERSPVGAAPVPPGPAVSSNEMERGGEIVKAPAPVVQEDTAVDSDREMVLIPAGPFTMGSADGLERESPVHLVDLDDFYLDKYEVTLGQFRACVEAGACSEPPEVTKCLWHEGVGDDKPVNCMTWYDAQSYCQWAGLRLPSEAEWEKAARGTDGRVYPWGDEVDRGRANYRNGFGGPIDVGSFPTGVSPYGLYDMGGNVWEWVEDWYDPTYYATSPRDNPAGPDTGTGRVLRGGSWCFSADALRATVREPYNPEGTDTDIGFRCARDPD